MTKQEPTNPITLANLYPDLDERERREAEENLESYLKLALRVYERVRGDQETYARFKALTGSGERSRIPSKPPIPS